MFERICKPFQKRKPPKKWLDLYQRGVDPAKLKKGDKVTVSPNLKTGTRFLTDQLFVVNAISDNNIQLERTGIQKTLYGSTIITIDEHHVYFADDFDIPPEK